MDGKVVQALDNSRGGQVIAAGGQQKFFKIGLIS